jgi:hypothetical protein
MFIDHLFFISLLLVLGGQEELGSALMEIGYVR